MNTAPRNVRKVFSASAKSGWVSSTTTPSRASFSAAALHTPRTSRSTARATPRSALKATRRGFFGRAAAAEKLGCGPTCDRGSCGCQPASQSNMSAVSATLRAIGPSTESGLYGCLDARGTMPGLGRRPVVEQ
ncbi:hypothetical protein D3C83_12020 [compost metagenome]